MAQQYFLYRTDLNNTLVDRSNTSFAPLPPNTNEIFIDFFIPNTQPLFFYRESGNNIVLNSQQNIDEYLQEINPPQPDDFVTQNEFTGYTVTTDSRLDDVELISDIALTGVTNLGTGTIIGDVDGRNTTLKSISVLGNLSLSGDANNIVISGGSGAAGSVSWGDIGGNISNQTDLNLQTVTNNGGNSSNPIILNNNFGFDETFFRVRGSVTSHLFEVRNLENDEKVIITSQNSTSIQRDTLKIVDFSAVGTGIGFGDDRSPTSTYVSINTTYTATEDVLNFEWNGDTDWYRWMSLSGNYNTSDPNDMRINLISLVNSERLINYNSDLSSTYTNRSLVDREYVDTLPLTVLNTTSAGATTTTSTAYVLQTGMQITSVPAGTYLVGYGNYFSHGTNNASIFTSIFVGGTAQAVSEMEWNDTGGGPAPRISTTHNYSNFVITLASTQTVEIRWRTSTGTATSTNRYLTLLKVSSIT